jgi:hypothetical protein
MKGEERYQVNLEHHELGYSSTFTASAMIVDTTTVKNQQGTVPETWVVDQETEITVWLAKHF